MARKNQMEALTIIGTTMIVMLSLSFGLAYIFIRNEEKHDNSYLQRDLISKLQSNGTNKSVAVEADITKSTYDTFKPELVYLVVAIAVMICGLISALCRMFEWCRRRSENSEAEITSDNPPPPSDAKDLPPRYEDLEQPPKYETTIYVQDNYS